MFVGTMSGRVRDRLWEQLSEKRAKTRGALLLIHNAPGEQGFALLSGGDGSRTAVDFDGLFLLARPYHTAGRGRKGNASVAPSPGKKEL